MTTCKLFVTFKKEKNDIWAKFSRTTIKVNKKECGFIDTTFGKPFAEIKFSIIKADIMEDGNPNCTWKWITLKKKFESETQARVFVKENIVAIAEKYNLYFFED